MTESSIGVAETMMAPMTTLKPLAKLASKAFTGDKGNAWPGQDYEVCNFYAPAECISTDLEGGANEEAVTKVVEEVSNQNCT